MLFFEQENVEMTEKMINEMKINRLFSFFKANLRF